MNLKLILNNDNPKIAHAAYVKPVLVVLGLLM